MDPSNKYTEMQNEHYEIDAKRWTVTDRNPVVGSFDQHNNWADYNKFLFGNLDTRPMIALDFGCGPGRNIVLFHNRFTRIDGADIAVTNLDNAKLWIQHNNLTIPTLYRTNGVNLDGISDAQYDMVFSTICMQHICVHSIRLAILKDMFRVLKAGGHICIQMGFGGKHAWNRRYAKYYEDILDAPGTNGCLDVSIEDPNDLEKELKLIGFQNFQYDLRPTGPGDDHKQWIFFRATKPNA
jgi:ubiquinone/menaquinone biosynthesis C-methylase UbiE